MDLKLNEDDNDSIDIEAKEVSEKYEDFETIARMTSAKTQLDLEFQIFEEEVLENFYLAAGEIYSTKDLKKYINERRPKFQSDLFNQYILQIAGNFKGNMPGLEFFGRTPDDHQLADMFKDINDFIMYQQNDTSYEIARAFLFTMIGRIAWIKQDYNYLKDPEGGVVLEMYNKFLRFDTSVPSRDFYNCNYVCDAGWFSPEEIISIYARGNYELSGLIETNAEAFIGKSDIYKNKLSTWAERIQKDSKSSYRGEKRGYDEKDIDFWKTGNDSDYYNGRGKFLVMDWYERRNESKKTLFHPDTRTIQDVSKMPEDELRFKKQLFAGSFIYEERINKIYQVSTSPGLYLKLFDGLQQLKNGNFKFTPLFWQDFHPNLLMTKSFVDITKDAVKNFNLRDNTILTVLQKSAHGGYLIEQSDATPEVIDKLKKNDIAGIIIVPDGSISNKRIQERTPPSMDSALINYQQQELNKLDRLSSVPPASVGISESKQESGTLHSQKIGQGEIMQEWPNENAQACLRVAAENNLWYIQNFYTDERTLRIVRDDGSVNWLTINQKVLGQIKNDVRAGKFDVVISTKPFGRNAKLIYFQEVSQIFEIAIKLGPEYKLVIIELFKYMITLKNIPSKEKIFKAIEIGTGITQETLQQQLAVQRSNTEKQLLGNDLQKNQMMDQAQQQSLMKDMADRVGYQAMIQQAASQGQGVQ